MFAPARVFASFPRRAGTGLVAASAAATVLFTATPFVVPAVVRDYGVPVGRAGLVSTAQIAGFALTTFLAGRRFVPHRRWLVAGALGGLGLNAVSALAPTFGSLLALRGLAGAAAGLLVWLAWTEAMRSPRSLGRIAAAGPVTACLGAPLLSWTAESGGTDGVFLVVGAAFVAPLVLPAGFGARPVRRRRLSPSRTNLVLIAALGVVTMAGSAVFVFGAVVGRDAGLSPAAVSIAFSLNALGGFAGTRLSTQGRRGGPWVFAIAACVIAVVFGGRLLFLVGMILWGFSFWMVVPPVLRSIAAWSLAPDERVGDAQSAMAVGRGLGPAAGAVLVGDGFTGAAIFAVAWLMAAGTVTVAVERYRRSHAPPAGASGSVERTDPGGTPSAAG